MELFVGNLPFSATEQEISDIFKAHGKVDSVKMLTDKFTGRFRGIAFVVMPDDAEAQSAIDALNNSDFGGRPMRVDRSRERTPRYNGFGGAYDAPRGEGFQRGSGRPRGDAPRGNAPRGRGAWRDKSADSARQDGEGDYQRPERRGGRRFGGDFKRSGDYSPSDSRPRGNFRPRRNFRREENFGDFDADE